MPLLTLGAVIASPAFVQSASAAPADLAALTAADKQLGAIMRATALKYAMCVGLGGLLALGTATGFGQLRTGTVAARQVTQYCIPPRDNPDAYRFYCGNEDGWADPAGAAFRLVHAGGSRKSLAA